MTWGGSHVQVMYRAPMDKEEREFRPTEQINSIGIGVTVLALVALAFFVDMNSLRIWVEQAGIWGPLVFIILKISTIVIAPLSGAPLYPLVGLLFGFWPGILYVVIGDFLGYTIAFSISRIFGRKLVIKFLSGKEEGLVFRIVDHIGNVKGFFHACLVLFALPEVLSYGAGLSKLSYIKFIFILMPFSIVAGLVLVLFGSLLDLKSGSLLIGLVIPVVGALAVIIGGTLFMRELKKRQTIF